MADQIIKHSQNHRRLFIPDLCDRERRRPVVGARLAEILKVSPPDSHQYSQANGFRDGLITMAEKTVLI